MRVGTDDRCGSLGTIVYIGYEMRAMRDKENNEKKKHHDSERECPMNMIKGSREKRWTSNDPGLGRNGYSDDTVTIATCMHL